MEFSQFTLNSTWGSIGKEACNRAYKRMAEMRGRL